jgi:hypothetical protein
MMADENSDDRTGTGRADHEPPPGAETIGTWTWTGADRSIDYTASASWTVLRKNDKPAAEIFSVSYVASGDDDRPLTFVFNGGPGASSAYLHMGAVGPTRVAFPADGTLPRMPPRLVSNDESWLAFTDLVFVDPVGTGFSRVIEGDAKQGDQSKKQADDRDSNDRDSQEYFGYKRDLESLCEFMGRAWPTSSGFRPRLSRAPRVASRSACSRASCCATSARCSACTTRRSRPPTRSPTGRRSRVPIPRSRASRPPTRRRSTASCARRSVWRPTVRYFGGGHMFYAWQDSRRAFTAAITAFVADAAA